jgi:hypothetical protein
MPRKDSVVHIAKKEPINTFEKRHAVIAENIFNFRNAD